MKMKIKPSFMYRFNDSMKGTVVFWGIVLIVIIVSFIKAAISGYSASGDFTGAYELSAMITIFVFGICTIRDDLRLAVQNGVGRTSAFIASLLSSAATALVMTAAGELIISVYSVIVKSFGNITVMRLYELIYMTGDEVRTVTGMTFTEHIISFLMTFALLLLATVGGNFLSLMYYRLSKFWIIAVSICIPVLLIFGTNAMITFLTFFADGALLKLIVAIFENPALLTLTLAILSAVVITVNWLITRHAPIKAAK